MRGSLGESRRIRQLAMGKPIATSAWSGADAVYTDASGNSFITGYVYGTAGIGTQNVGGQ